jgi:hypothetical protein
MNERIQELARVAEQLADDELAHLERLHNRLYSFTEGREIYNQKFAELIVRECVGILETEIADVLAPKTIFNQDEWDKNNMCFTLLVNMITLTKEHFGVEE